MAPPAFRSWRYPNGADAYAAWKAMYDVASESGDHGVGLWRTRRADDPHAHYVFLMDYSDGHQHIATCEPLAGDGVAEPVDEETEKILARRHLRVASDQPSGEPSTVRMHHGPGRYLHSSDGQMRDYPEPRASRKES